MRVVIWPVLSIVSWAPLGSEAANPDCCAQTAPARLTRIPSNRGETYERAGPKDDDRNGNALEDRAATASVGPRRP